MLTCIWGILSCKMKFILFIFSFLWFTNSSMVPNWQWSFEFHFALFGFFLQSFELLQDLPKILFDLVLLRSNHKHFHTKLSIGSGTVGLSYCSLKCFYTMWELLKSFSAVLNTRFHYCFGFKQRSVILLLIFQLLTNLMVTSLYFSYFQL